MPNIDFSLVQALSPLGPLLTHRLQSMFSTFGWGKRKRLSKFTARMYSLWWCENLGTLLSLKTNYRKLAWPWKLEGVGLWEQEIRFLTRKQDKSCNLLAMRSSLHSQYVWLFLISLLVLLNTCRLPPLVHHRITLPIHHVVEMDHLLHHSGTWRFASFSQSLYAPLLSTH